MKTEDEILKEISEHGFVSFTKHDSKERWKAKDRLQAFNLICEYSKLHFKLTQKGYKAVEIGFENWMRDTENDKATVNPTNISIIKGDNNKVRLSSSNNSKNKATSEGHRSSNGENRFSLLLKKIWWKILIPVIIGILLIAIERDWFY